MDYDKQDMTLSEAIAVIREIEPTDPGTPDWSIKKDGMSRYCSNCRHKAWKWKHTTYRSCPWCSAKMDLEEADVDA